MQPDLKKNYIYRLCYEVLCFAIPLFTTPYISRVLGADGVGKYSFTYSVISWFMIFGALGTASYGTREISRNRDDKKICSKLFWEIETVSIITCAACLILWGVFICLTKSYRPLYFALTPFLIGTMFDVSWFFAGLERVKVTVLINSLAKILGAALLFAFVRKSEDVIVYCIISSGIVLFGNLVMWIFLPGYVAKIDISDIKLKQHFRETFIYFIPTVASSVYFILDKTLIGVITDSPSENGYYEQASRVIGVAKAFSFFVLNSVVSVRMSYLYSKEDYEGMKEKMIESIDAILFLGFGAVFGLLGISHVLVPAFFGAGYEPVERLVYLMLPIIIIVGISSCLEYQYFIPTGKRALSTRYIIAGAVTNLILNLLLIPTLGAGGAVAASVAAEFLIMILYMMNCERAIDAGHVFSFSWKRVIVGIVMAITVSELGKLNTNSVVKIIIQLAVGALLYIGLLAAIKDSFIKRVLRERKR